MCLNQSFLINFNILNVTESQVTDCSVSFKRMKLHVRILGLCWLMMYILLFISTFWSHTTFMWHTALQRQANLRTFTRTYSNRVQSYHGNKLPTLNNLKDEYLLNPLDTHYAFIVTRAVSSYLPVTSSSLLFIQFRTSLCSPPIIQSICFSLPNT